MSCCCGAFIGGMINSTTPFVLDSSTITDLVRNAGGNVNALFRASLAWDSWSDLDLHLNGPNNLHIYFSNRLSVVTSGELDVDMNVGSALHAQNSASKSKPAVENIVFTDLGSMPDGDYALSFVQYGSYRDRAPGADRPYLLLEHRTPEETPLSHYVLLKDKGDNFPTDTGVNHRLVTVRKTGASFRLVAKEPSVEILEVHNFDTGDFRRSEASVGGATENAATTGVNPTGG